MIFQVQGTVTKVGSVVNGTNKNGNPYMLQEFVLSEFDERGYEYLYPFSVINGSIDRNAFCFSEGNVVNVHFGIDAKPTQRDPNKLYVNLRFFKAEFIGNKEMGAQTIEQAVQQQQQLPTYLQQNPPQQVQQVQQVQRGPTQPLSMFQQQPPQQPQHVQTQPLHQGDKVVFADTPKQVSNDLPF